MKKYHDEKLEAVYAATHENVLPHKIKNDKPNLLAAAFSRVFQQRGIRDVSLSIDPDNDGVWIWKRKRP